MTRTASKTIVAAVLGVALIGAGACTRTERYAATGAGVGAVGGAVVAGATGGNVLAGSVIGAGAGAIGGALVAQ
jgi:hypothetical protein